MTDSEQSNTRRLATDVEKYFRDRGVSPPKEARAVSKLETRELLGFEFAAGIAIPYKDPFSGKPYKTADQKPFVRVRAFEPLNGQQRYSSPKGNGNRPYFPDGIDWPKVLPGDGDIAVTEGEAKAIAGSTLMPTIGLAGIESIVDKRDRETGEKLESSRVLPELTVKRINWKRRVYIIYDGCTQWKEGPRKALERVAHHLKSLGAEVYIVRLPMLLDGSEAKLDDLLFIGGAQAKDFLQLLIRHAERAFDEQGKYSFPLEPKPCKLKALLLALALSLDYSIHPELGLHKWTGTHWERQGSNPRTVRDCICSASIKISDFLWWEKSPRGELIEEVRNRLRVESKLWDSRHLRVFSNGVLNTHSGKFLPGHQRWQYLQRSFPYPYDPAAMCPKWEQCLADWIPPQYQEIIRAAMRFTLGEWDRSQLSPLQQAYILRGRSGSGKGSFLQVLEQLVGPSNCGTAKPKVFKDPAGLFGNLGKLAAIDHDSKGVMSEVDTFNSVVSNEPVLVKELYVGTRLETLGNVVWMAMNLELGLSHDSAGFFERLLVVPFNENNFRKDGETNLGQLLKEELPGIFNWVWGMTLDEAIELLQAAKSQQGVQKQVQRLREDSDPLAAFLVETFPNGGKCAAQALYKQWSKHCKEEQAPPGKRNGFRSRLLALGVRQRKEGAVNYYSIPTQSELGQRPKASLSDNISHNQPQPVKTNHKNLTSGAKSYTQKGLQPCTTSHTVHIQKVSRKKSEGDESSNRSFSDVNGVTGGGCALVLTTPEIEAPPVTIQSHQSQPVTAPERCCEGGGDGPSPISPVNTTPPTSTQQPPPGWVALTVGTNPSEGEQLGFFRDAEFLVADVYVSHRHDVTLRFCGERLLVSKSNLYCSYPKGTHVEIDTPDGRVNGHWVEGAIPFSTGDIMYKVTNGSKERTLSADKVHSI